MSKVSVIIPACRADENSSRSIDSVLRQSHGDWELILAHDNSNGDLNGLIREYGDARIKEVRGITLPEGVDRALKESSGEYVTLLHAGDAMHSDRLRIQLKRMLRNTDVTVCATWIRPLSNDIMNLYRCELDGYVDNPIRMLLKGNFVYRSAAMVEKSFLSKHEISFGWKYLPNGEYGLWLDIFRRGGTIYIEPQHLTYIRADSADARQHHDLTEEMDELLRIRRMVLDCMFESVEDEMRRNVWTDLLASFDRAERAGVIHKKTILDIFHSIFHK